MVLLCEISQDKNSCHDSEQQEHHPDCASERQSADCKLVWHRFILLSKKMPTR